MPKFHYTAQLMRKDIINIWPVKITKSAIYLHLFRYVFTFSFVCICLYLFSADGRYLMLFNMIQYVSHEFSGFL